ncbi:MAG: YfdX family protein [Acidobacteriia bacterium]|nr:YfdX family protein [Terriglobia bacterium]
MTRSYYFFAAAAAALTAAWGQDLPGMAVGILQQTEEARQAVVERDRNAALDHVRQASTLAADIEQHAPAGANPILVPVYQEVDSTSVYRPVKPGKNEELNARRLKRDTSVREVEGTTTIARLNVTTAADSLKTARAALERNDWTTADTALASIPDGIVRTAARDGMPLLKARENLTLARDRVLDGNPKAAAAPLRAAAEALADFEKLAPGPRAQDAESMRQKIEACARDIGDRHADAPQEIGAWLESVDHWRQEFAK